MLPAYADAQLAFGYPWWLSYGHVVIIAAAALLLLLGYSRKWSKWPTLFAGAVLLWSTAAFLVARFVINANGRATCANCPSSQPRSTQSSALTRSIT